MRKSLILSLVVPLLLVVITQVAYSQKERRIIQLSGVVLGLDDKGNAGSFSTTFEVK